MDTLQSVEKFFEAYVLLLELNVLEAESVVFSKREDKQKKLLNAKSAAMLMAAQLALAEVQHVTLAEKSFDNASTLIVEIMNSLAEFQAEMFPKRDVVKLADRRRLYIKGLMQSFSKSDKSRVEEIRKRFKTMKDRLQDLISRIEVLEAM